MEVALGTKAHSGWAALVVIAKRNGEYVVVDRRRIELVEDEWAKQPYHAAETLKPAAARALVERGVAAAHTIAFQQIRAAIDRERERKNQVKSCAVLVGQPMPDWTTDEILAVHFRMHKAEGVLFRDALAQASKDCKLRLVEVSESQLMECAVKSLKTSESLLMKTIAALGKSVGPPWGKDQKEATLAAMIALAAK
jgi:hypothetical protein